MVGTLCHTALSQLTCPAQILTIRLLSSEDEDEEDFRSRWGPGDFCKAFTLVSEPGNEAGGVADKPVADPKLEKGTLSILRTSKR